MISKIVEVGPRDGFQNINQFIPTNVKLEIIDRLVAAGMKRIQITSFVSPKAIPQMADSSEVARECIKKYGESVELFALVPNLRGAQNAVNAGLKEISTVLSLSEAHNKANVGCTVDESVERMKAIVEAYPDIRMSQDIATVFGCPFEGEMKLDALLSLIEKLIAIGMNTFTLCDTIGVAYPRQVKEIVKKVTSEFPEQHFNVHIHDTRNMGILNSYIALENGAESVQTTLGGLGGCPFAPGASGNTATEDFANLAMKEGIVNGIDVEKLVEAARYEKSLIEGKYSGHLMHVTANSCS